MTELHAAAIDKTNAATAVPAAESRWLFVDLAATFGGHERMLLRWLEELRRQRIVHAHLLAPHDSMLATEAARHCDVHTVRFDRHRTNGLRRQLAGMLAFIRLALKLRPQLCIVAEGCLLDQPLKALAARLMGLRIVEYVPLVDSSERMGFGRGALRDAIVKHVYRRCLHGWVTLSRAQAESFREWSGVTVPILVLPNTVDRDIEATTVSRRTEVDRLRVLVLGRIEAHQKGLDLLLDFMASRPDLGEQLQVTFVGSGPFEAELRDRLSQNADLSHWATVKGWCDPLTAFRDHDVLLMTSRYEGVPLVMLEAMALGVPIVAPDLPGIRAYVDPSVLFSPCDMQAAFDKLQGLFERACRDQITDIHRRRFEQLASNAAFSVAARSLTLQLRALERVQRRSA